MKIFVSGGTGFVGKHVVEEILRSTSYTIKLLTHNTNGIADPRVEVFQGTILSFDDVMNAMEGCDAVIHLVGIIKETKPDITFQALHVEATQNVIKAMQQLGISRLIHMSALGVDSGVESLYFMTKALAEECVTKSGLKYTILRPSIVWGNEGFKQELEFITSIPIISPIIGTGTTKFQPIVVEDLAEFIVRAIDSKEMRRKIVEIGGPEIYTFEQLVSILEEVEKKKKLHTHIPLSYVLPFFRITKHVDIPFPVTEDQLKMLQADNIVQSATRFLGETQIFNKSN